MILFLPSENRCITDSKILTLTLTGDFYFIYAYFYFLIFKSQHKTKKKFFLSQSLKTEIYINLQSRERRKSLKILEERWSYSWVTLSQLWLRTRSIRRTAEISTHRVQTVGTTMSVTICMWLSRGSEMEREHHEWAGHHFCGYRLILKDSAVLGKTWHMASSGSVIILACSKREHGEFNVF